NVLSGNQRVGVFILGASTNNVIAGNFIGTDVNRTAALANGWAGVRLDGGASGNTVGGLTPTPGSAPGNFISGNQGEGVLITGAGTGGNAVAGNLIGGPGTLGNGGSGVAISGGASGNSIGVSASEEQSVAVTGFSNGTFTLTFN